MTAEFVEGQILPPVAHPPVTRVQIARYAGAVNDFIPIHVDEEFARAAGLKSVIAHGQMSLAMLVSALEGWVPPTSRITKISGRFVGMNTPGSEITCKGVVSRVGPGFAEFDLEAVVDSQTITSAKAVIEF